MSGATGLRAGVAIPAAGSGERLGGFRKAFLELRGEPLLAHTLRPFLSHPAVRTIVVALPASDAASPPEWLRKDSRVELVEGGRTRGHSVQAALAALEGRVDVVLVHDAARPLVTEEIIDRCIVGAGEGEGAVAAWPVVDTLKEVDGDGIVLGTPDRARFRRAQTPQAFPLAPLAKAYRAALEEGVIATDDAAVFSRSGGRVRTVEGSAWNLKVTHPDDVRVAEALLSIRRTPPGSRSEG